MPLLTIAVLVIFLPLVYTSATLDPTQPLRFLILSVAAVLLSVQLLFPLRRGQDDRVRSVLTMPIFSACGIYFLASAVSLAQAVNFAEAIYDLSKVLIMLVLLITTSLVFALDKKSVPGFCRSMLISGTILAFVGACQYYGIAFTTIPGHVAPYATMANKNLLSCLLCLTLPCAMLEAVGQDRRWSIVGIVASALILFVVIIGQTRASWLGLMIATMAIVPIYLIWVRNLNISGKSLLKSEDVTARRNATKRSAVPASRSRRVRVALLASLALIILVAAGSGVVLQEGQSSVIDRLISIFTHQDSSSQIRLAVWQKSWELCKQHPFAGIGIGNWKIVCPGLGLTGTKAETADLYFQQPHNDYLWILSETGVVGLAAYLSLFGFAGYYVIRTLRGNPTREVAFFMLFMLFAVIYFLVDSTFSYPRERVELVFILTLILAAIVATHHRCFPSTKKFPQSAVLIILSACLLLSIATLILGVVRLKGELHIKEVWLAKSAKNWPEVIRQVDQARSRWLTLDPTAAPLAWYRGIAQSSLNRREEACREFALAYRDNPNHPHVLNNLGTCAELGGDHRQAQGYYEQAIRVAPQFNEAWLNLTATFYNLGEFQRADSALSHVDSNFGDPRVASFKQMIAEGLKTAKQNLGQ